MFIAPVGFASALRWSATHSYFAPPELGYGLGFASINISPLRGEERRSHSVTA